MAHFCGCFFILILEEVFLFLQHVGDVWHHSDGGLIMVCILVCHVFSIASCLPLNLSNSFGDLDQYLFPKGLPVDNYSCELILDSETSLHIRDTIYFYC